MTRVAAIQMISGADPDANLKKAGHLIAEAVDGGAELVVLPENFAMMTADDGERHAIRERAGRGPIQDFLSQQARRHRIWLVGGTIPLAAHHRHKVRSACLLFDAQGKRVARYDKIHLFDVRLESGEQYQESKGIEPGDKVIVTDTPVGRLGLAVCYDLRFPELFRKMLDQGAEIFAIPSAFTAVTGKAHWETLVRARAIENLAYVIAPDQGGRHGNGRVTHGHSLIVSPWGEVLDRCEQGPGVVTARIESDRLASVRRRLPSIRHRRIGVESSVVPH